MAAQVHVVGGGVIGLACAWELSRNGHEVTVVSPTPGPRRRVVGGGRDARTGDRGTVRRVRADGVAARGRRTLACVRRRARSGERPRPSDTTRRARSRSRSMRPTAPASTTSSPTSTRSGSRRTRRSASECRGLVPALSPVAARRHRGARRPPGRQPRAPVGPASKRTVPAGVTFDRGTRDRRRSRARARPGGRPPPRVRTRSSWRPGSACRASPDWTARRLPEVRPVKGHILRLGPAPRRHGPAARAHRARPGARALGLPGAAARRLARRGCDRRGAGCGHRRCRPAPCTSCSATPAPSCPASTSSSCSRRPPACARPRPTTCRASVGAALDGVAGGDRPLPQRHPPRAPHRGRRGRPARRGGRWRRCSRRWPRRERRSRCSVNGEPVEVAVGVDHRRPGRRAHRGGRPQGRRRRRRPLRRAALGVGHHAGPRRLPGRGGERGRRGVTPL